MIPTTNELMKPILEFSDKEVDTKELEEHLAKQFNLSEQERNLVKNSGGERLFLNKIRWAKTHLHYAGLIEFTKRNWYKVTSRGKEFIRTVSDKITEKQLYQFKEYVEKRLKIVFEYAYCNANKWTFQMKPVRELLEQESKGIVIDPTCGQSDFADIRNDINPDSKAHSNLDALEFLKRIRNNFAHTFVLDLPYSPTQIAEYSKRIEKTRSHSKGLKTMDDRKKVTFLDTSSRFYSAIKDEVSRILKLGGKVISFGWNSVGMGKSRGFKKEKIMLICHGGSHNDTIITVEEKIE